MPATLTPDSCRARCRPATGAPEWRCPRGTSGICPPWRLSPVSGCVWAVANWLGTTLLSHTCGTDARRTKCSIPGIPGGFGYRTTTRRTSSGRSETERNDKHNSPNLNRCFPDTVLSVCARVFEFESQLCWLTAHRAAKCGSLTRLSLAISR